MLAGNIGVRQLGDVDSSERGDDLRPYDANIFRCRFRLQLRPDMLIRETRSQLVLWSAPSWPRSWLFVARWQHPYRLPPRRGSRALAVGPAPSLRSHERQSSRVWWCLACRGDDTAPNRFAGRWASPSRQSPSARCPTDSHPRRPVRGVQRPAW
jgi:hypothetical protein